MKPKFAVSAILLLMTASLAQTGTAQQAEDLYQGTVVTRQETQDSITYTLKEDLSFSGFRTEDTVFAGSVFFNQLADHTRPASESVMTFTGTGMSMSFDDCSSIHSDRWVNDNEGGGAIRGETLTFTDMGDLSFNNCKSIVNADTNAGGAVNARGDITFSHMGNISFTNNMLGDDSQQGQALGGALFTWGKIDFENTKSILFSGNSTGHSPTSAHSNIGGAIYAGAHDSTSTATKAYIPAGEYALTFQNVTGNMTFENNSAWIAGAIYAYAGAVDGYDNTGGGMKIAGVTGDVIFRNNRADAGELASDWNGNFGAVYRLHHLHRQPRGQDVCRRLDQQGLERHQYGKHHHFRKQLGQSNGRCSRLRQYHVQQQWGHHRGRKLHQGFQRSPALLRNVQRDGCREHFPFRKQRGPVQRRH